MTSRARAKQVLLKAGALRRAILNSTNISSIATDTTGIIQSFNRGAERMLGYSAADVMHFITPADISDSTDLIARAASLSLELETTITPGFQALVIKASRGVEDIYELSYIRKDGSLFPAVVSVTALHDDGGTIIGYLFVGMDNTARKRIEAELEQAKAVAESASQIKSDFLASMSHEIRTPINAITGIAHLLARTHLSDEQARYVEIFRRASENLLGLIDSILDFSKVEAAQLALETAEFSLADIVERVMEMLGAPAQQKGLRLSCEITPNVPICLIGDPNRLSQILLNLIGNAIKFTEHGEVSLRITQDIDVSVKNMVRFTVSDTGIGIPQEKIAVVFDRFTQADSSTTRRYGGSGLGLTISKRLVELMGGTIRVESNTGEGSVFSFAIPLETWSGRVSQVGAEVTVRQDANLPPLRILLVDDYPDNRTIILAYLQDTPYHVEIAENGLIACEKFFSGSYDLILMDRQMPVMDGLSAARAIRAWEQENHRHPTPIIALTAAALKGDRDLCIASGCDAYLAKPIKQDVLLRAISKFAERPQLARPLSDGLSATILARKFADRIQLFLRNRRLDIIRLSEALDIQDFTTIEFLGHGMRGAGGMFGFPGITVIGAALEQGALVADTASLKSSVQDLSDYLDIAEQGIH